jgi:GTP cyclohydrolase II
MNNTIKQVESARIPTALGEFNLCLYSNGDGKEHLALIMGEVEGHENVLVRVHSECFTGDVLGSRRCDCGYQLDQSMKLISDEGAGLVIYLRQEGRGIGLLDKLRAYNLQDEGYDTVDANLLLGHQADEREYSIAAQILEDLDIRSIRLLTNNPTKVESLSALGVTIKARLPLEGHVTPENAGYLQTKAVRMRHKINLEEMMEPSAHDRPDGSGNGRSA